ncbi:MAG: 2-C-methyl-D-erythritol 4-phosphate cytidylyltransferase [Burkholderiales bacterium]
MGGGLPKQYFEIAGRPLLYHAAQRLIAHPRIERVFVVLAPDDDRFARFDWNRFGRKLEPLYCGGETRAASVFNGLLAANDAIDAADWVLVHDAARPCLGAAELERLIGEIGDDATGGLLAIPLADTLKRASQEGRVLRTESRENLWRAQTPQMFRYRLLVEALRASAPAAVTDEANAIEKLGLHPRLVMGDAHNLKVTYPRDLALAELVLKSMANADESRSGSKAGREGS